MRDRQNVRGGDGQADARSDFDQAGGRAEDLDDYDAMEPDFRDSVFEDAMRSIAFSGEGKP